MLTDDDERTLQVLEAVAVGGLRNLVRVVADKIGDGTLTVGFTDTVQMAMDYVSDETGKLNRAGRAEFARLRKLKGVSGDVAG